MLSSSRGMIKLTISAALICWELGSNLLRKLCQVCSCFNGDMFMWFSCLKNNTGKQNSALYPLKRLFIIYVLNFRIKIFFFFAIFMDEICDHLHRILPVDSTPLIDNMFLTEKSWVLDTNGRTVVIYKLVHYHWWINLFICLSYSVAWRSCLHSILAKKKTVPCVPF